MSTTLNKDYTLMSKTSAFDSSGKKGERERRHREKRMC